MNQSNFHFGKNASLLRAVFAAKRRPLNAGSRLKDFTPEQLAQLYVSMVMKVCVSLIILFGGLVILALGIGQENTFTSECVTGLMGSVVGYWLG